MAHAHTEYVRLFPPKSSKTRQAYGTVSKGKVVAIRPPEELLEFLERRDREGYTRTEVMIKVALLGMEVAEEMGADWWEVERRASEEGITSGRALARFALEGIRAARKGRK